jgi:hypothetical protein
MDEDSEKCTIEDLPVVSSVCFHVGDKTHKSGVYVNLRCVCGAKQVRPVHKSSKRPTFGDCLRELGRLIQQDHGPTCVTTAQKLQAAEKDADEHRLKGKLLKKMLWSIQKTAEKDAPEHRLRGNLRHPLSRSSVMQRLLVMSSHIAHSSGSALASHVLQKRVAHGARRFAD